MLNILESASKIILILVGVTACAGFLMGILEPKDFMLLAGMVFTFYFAYKGNEGGGNTPFAGK